MTSPDDLRADVRAQLARVDAMFDDVIGHAIGLKARYADEGLLRDPATRTRSSDPGVQA